MQETPRLSDRHQAALRRVHDIGMSSIPYLAEVPDVSGPTVCRVPARTKAAGVKAVEGRNASVWPTE